MITGCIALIFMVPTTLEWLKNGLRMAEKQLENQIWCLMDLFCWGLFCSIWVRSLLLKADPGLHCYTDSDLDMKSWVGLLLRIGSDCGFTNLNPNQIGGWIRVGFVETQPRLFSFFSNSDLYRSEKEGCGFPDERRRQGGGDNDGGADARRQSRGGGVDGLRVGV